MKYLRLFVVGCLALVRASLGADSSVEQAPFYSDRTNLLVVMGAGGRLLPVKSATDWQRRREHILANMQEVMGPVPTPWKDLPLDLEVLSETAEPKYIRKRITYRAEPKDAVSAWLLIPRERQGKLPAVLCLHQTTEIGKDEPAGLGGNTNLHYARELAERGFVALAPDYWTFGDYRQRPYDPYEHGYASGTMKGIWNHIRAVDLLESLPEVDRERIGGIGHSLGGHNTLWLGAFDPRLRALVSSCGFNSLRSYAASPYGGGTLKNYAQKRYLPRIETRYGNDPTRVPFDWPEVLAALAPRPVFVNAPLRDENFVVEGVRECVNAAQPVYRLLEAPDALQAVYPDAEHTFPPDIRRQAYEFLERALRRE